MKSGIGGSFCRLFYGFDYLHVTGAHAQIAAERLTYFFFGGLRMITQKRMACHYHSRGAIAALQRIMLNEGFLNYTQLTVFGQSLYGGHTAAVDLHGEM